MIYWEKTYHSTTNGKDEHVDDGQGALPRARPPLPVVHVQPVGTRQTETEPTGKQRTDQTDQVAERWDTLADDPSNHPAGHANTDPGSHGDPVVLVHTSRLAEDAHIDVLKTNMSVDHTSTNTLHPSEQILEHRKRVDSQ